MTKPNSRERKFKNIVRGITREKEKESFKATVELKTKKEETSKTPISFTPTML